MDTNLYLIKTDEPLQKQTFQSFLKTSIGIWIDGNIYWMRDCSEKIIAEEAISIVVKEGSLHSKTKIHEVFIKNHGDQRRKLKLLLMHHYPKAEDDLFTFVSPTEKVFFHIKNDFIFLVNAHLRGRGKEQMTVQPLWNISTNNLWQSLDKGVLKYQPMAKGMMVSIFSFPLTMGAKETSKASSWIVCGYNKEQLIQLNHAIKKVIFP